MVRSSSITVSQVLAPALATASQPDLALSLRGLLTACAEVIAAVAGQPAWLQLHQETALATLCAIGVCAVSCLSC